MITLAKNGDRTLVYDESNKQHFTVLTKETQYHFNNIEYALLTLYNIKYNWETVERIMDIVNIEDYDVFECSRCGKTYTYEERCKEHYHGGERTCKYCCEQCQNDINYWNDINERIDNERHPE